MKARAARGWIRQARKKGSRTKCREYGSSSRRLPGGCNVSAASGGAGLRGKARAMIKTATGHAAVSARPGQRNAQAASSASILVGMMKHFSRR
jgi:hypothetical protein